MPLSIAQLIPILVLTGAVYMIIWEMFHKRISLNLVLLLLLMNFVGGPRLKLMYITSTVNIRKSVVHIHDFHLLEFLPQLTEITSFVCTYRINLLRLKRSSGKQFIVAKDFLKRPNLLMLTKQNSTTSRKLRSYDFWQIANSFLNKGKSAIGTSST